jgi:hypothetical protein
MVVSNNESTATENAGKLLAISIAMQMRRYDAGEHLPMEHVKGFIQSHWMPPLGQCLRHITQAAAMVDKFVETTQNTNKTQLLASNYKFNVGPETGATWTTGFLMCAHCSLIL